MTKSKLFAGLAAFLVICGGGYALYHYRNEAQTIVTNVLYKPCTSPIPFTVGDIDPRFNLTRSQVVEELAKATALWSDAYGSPLFSYEPDNSKAMPIIFVYDRRQQTITVGNEITSVESSQQQARTEVEAARSAYTQAGNVYSGEVDQLNADLKAYSDKVAKINAAGGATPAQYKALQAERAALETRQQDLKQKGEALSAQGKALQQMINGYNSKVSDINKIVETFNATSGGEFEEGLYMQDAQGKRIYVYAYKTRSELLHTLAHELGHSLGIDHNDNPESIMFAYNKNSVALSTEDLSALRTACGQ